MISIFFINWFLMSRNLSVIVILLNTQDYWILYELCCWVRHRYNILYLLIFNVHYLLIFNVHYLLTVMPITAYQVVIDSIIGQFLVITITNSKCIQFIGRINFGKYYFNFTFDSSSKF